MEDQWHLLSSEQKMEARFAGWLSPPGIKFKNAGAESAYQARVTRIKDAIQLKKTPDRVPLLPLHTFLPAQIAGITNEEAMYEPRKLILAWKKFIFEYEPDGYNSPMLVCSGQPLETLGYSLYRWPGHGVSPASPYQYVEKEYMKADEYELLIQDPSGYWMHTYLPRIFNELEPMKRLPPLTNIVELPAMGPDLIQYGLPEIQKMFKAVLKAGSQAMKWGRVINTFEQEMTQKGYPSGMGGSTKAPFDILGDTLRGTRGIMMDMYRQPDKLLEALEKMTPLYIRMGMAGPDHSGNPIVFIPLHKGADGFMSDQQFKTFYWPSLKQLILGLVEEGCVPMLFAEGSYDSRLAYLKELPKGRTLWVFDRSNMAKVKQELGDTICIAGNVPASLIVSGTPQAVREYCKHLIDTVGGSGGYIMSCGTALDEARAENLKAMFEVTREFGVYHG